MREVVTIISVGTAELLVPEVGWRPRLAEALLDARRTSQTITSILQYYM